MHPIVSFLNDLDSAPRQSEDWPREMLVTNRDLLCDDVIGLTLRSANRESIRWEPGAHVSVNLPGTEIVRAYSIYGSLREDEICIAVRRNRESRGGSIWLHENAYAGTVLNILALKNNFPLEHANRYLFIAGGIGITPILPMISSCKSKNIPHRLVYCGRSKLNMAFLSSLSTAETTIHQSDISGDADMMKLLAEVGPQTEIYACGPPSMLDDLVASSERLNRLDRLHIERFSVNVPISSAEDREFEVFCQRSGLRVQIPAAVSILNALRAAGIEHSAQCEQGVCGTCETEVISGEPDHRDALLSDEERREGKSILICVSRSKTPTLNLNI